MVHDLPLKQLCEIAPYAEHFSLTQFSTKHKLIKLLQVWVITFAASLDDFLICVVKFLSVVLVATSSVYSINEVVIQL